LYDDFIEDIKKNKSAYKKSRFFEQDLETRFLERFIYNPDIDFNIQEELKLYEKEFKLKGEKETVDDYIVR
jgi:hypothetical protein